MWIGLINLLFMQKPTDTADTRVGIQLITFNFLQCSSSRRWNERYTFMKGRICVRYQISVTRDLTSRCGSGHVGKLQSREDDRLHLHHKWNGVKKFRTEMLGCVVICDLVVAMRIMWWEGAYCCGDRWLVGVVTWSSPLLSLAGSRTLTLYPDFPGPGMGITHTHVTWLLNSCGSQVPVFGVGVSRLHFWTDFCK